MEHKFGKAAGRRFGNEARELSDGELEKVIGGAFLEEMYRYYGFIKYIGSETITMTTMFATQAQARAEIVSLKASRQNVSDWGVMHIKDDGSRELVESQPV